MAKNIFDFDMTDIKHVLDIRNKHKLKEDISIDHFDNGCSVSLVNIPTSHFDNSVIPFLAELFANEICPVRCLYISCKYATKELIDILNGSTLTYFNVYCDKLTTSQMNTITNFIENGEHIIRELYIVNDHNDSSSTRFTEDTVPNNPSLVNVILDDKHQVQHEDLNRKRKSILSALIEANIDFVSTKGRPAGGGDVSKIISGYVDPNSDTVHRDGFNYSGGIRESPDEYLKRCRNGRNEVKKIRKEVESRVFQSRQDFIHKSRKRRQDDVVKKRTQSRQDDDANHVSRISGLEMSEHVVHFPQ